MPWFFKKKKAAPRTEEKVLAPESYRVSSENARAKLLEMRGSKEDEKRAAILREEAKIKKDTEEKRNKLHTLLTALAEKIGAESHWTQGDDHYYIVKHGDRYHLVKIKYAA
jgi:hypothetical protein